MKILLVIHGYPPYYSAGSEVYTRMLAQALCDNSHEVRVFARYENIFHSDYSYKTELDQDDPRILLHLINMPKERFRFKFVHSEIDNKFKEVLTEFNPDIVHYGHLNHLSLNLPLISKDFGCVNIFTLHDFWLLCSRGQFLKRNSREPWELCSGAEPLKCTKNCYSGLLSGDDDLREEEVNMWSKILNKREEYVHKVITSIDQFIAPSKFLQKQFSDLIPETKMVYLDYGFDLKRLQGRQRIAEPDFVYGYIGTLTPQKGVDQLLLAFVLLAQSNSNIRLRIWGKASDYSNHLMQVYANLSDKVKSKIEWKGGYVNENIVREVFNYVDAIIVPSIWGENSPLVIHEAQHLAIPVITAAYGGMAEYVEHYRNGLLFKHRNFKDLADKMLLLSNDAALYQRLTAVRYLYSQTGDIPDINDHVLELEGIYATNAAQECIQIPEKPGPWRITFDTNPDHCNYKCVMCECFSPHSDVQQQRVAQGIAKRVMPIDTIRKILAESVGTPLREIIPSTMGEPLMYKEFDQIVEMCHEYNLKLNLTTNGSFPIKGVHKWAEQLVPVLSDIKFSWNGASKEVNEKIMLNSNWEKSLYNLKEFLNIRDAQAQKGKNRCTVTLQLTFLETNLTDLEDLLHMAISLGVDRLKGHHLWAHFDQIKELSMRRNQESISRWNMVVKNLFTIADKYLLPNGTKIKLENFTILDIKAYQDLAPGGPCPFLAKEAWFNTEGEFSPCCAPDELRKSLGKFGNINDTTLQSIWHSKEYRELQKSYLNYELCKNCNMRKSLVNSQLV